MPAHRTQASCGVAPCTHSLALNSRAINSLRIGDFGTAVRLAPKEQCTSRVGTSGYMAPEVLGKESYGTPVDLWSLGIILYTLLCGRPPFDNSDEVREERDIKACRWSFAGGNWAEVSDEAKEVVRRLLAKLPADRPTALEALQLPWARPAFADASVDKHGGAQRLGERASRMTRVGSLPGSASLLEIKGLEKYAAARHASQAAFALSGPTSAPHSSGPRWGIDASSSDDKLRPSRSKRASSACASAVSVSVGESVGVTPRQSDIQHDL